MKTRIKFYFNTKSPPENSIFKYFGTKELPLENPTKARKVLESFKKEIMYIIFPMYEGELEVHITYNCPIGLKKVFVNYVVYKISK